MMEEYDMNEQAFTNKLIEILDEVSAVDDDMSLVGLASYEEAGLLTQNNGLIVKMENGDRFQVTVVKV